MRHAFELNLREVLSNLLAQLLEVASENARSGSCSITCGVIYSWQCDRERSTNPCHISLKEIISCKMNMGEIQR